MSEEEKIEEKKVEEQVEEKPIKKSKVAIVGFASSRDQAPFDNPEYEIWTVNNLHNFVPRQDRIFQVHQRWEWTPGHGNVEEHGVKSEVHEKYLQTCGIPVYCVQKFDDIPTSIRFPIEEMTEEFGIQRTGHEDPDTRDGFWTNSISMMIALAIYEGFEVIEVYGVDMAVDSEYHWQRPSCEYYIGIAKGRGIDVRLPPESDLLKTRFIYGFENDKIDAWKKKLHATTNAMQQRKAEAERVVRMQQSISDKYEGAISAMQEMDKTWK